MLPNTCNAKPPLFSNPPLLDLLGYIPFSLSEAILNGTYLPPPDTPYFASILLCHMHHPDTLSPDTTTDSFIETTDHWDSWKWAKEYTTAGLSGLRFGMFKAQIKDPDLAMYNAVRQSIPYQHGMLQLMVERG